MILRFLLAITLLVTTAAPSSLATSEPSAFATSSGSELVRQLQDTSTRSRAFHELWRRAKPGNDIPFSEFQEDHYNIEVVVCPQGTGRDPLHLVLYSFLSRMTYSTGEEYPLDDPDAIFPPAPASRSAPNHRPAFVVFTADGTLITPFGGNNVLEGTLADINGDEILERIEITHFDIRGIDSVSVLEVSSVKPTPEPLLAVLVNWGADEWTFRLRDNPARGVPDIELGPRTADGLKPKAVFYWDTNARTFTGPEGETNDHFRRLSHASGDLPKQLKRLQASKLTFPKDPDYVRHTHSFSGRKAEKPVPPPAQPYQRRSLADLPHAELLRLMMESGRNAYHFERESIVQNHLPSDFWTLPAQDAARALVESHRSPEHRARYQLAFDDRLAARPPEVATLTFSDASARCYTAVDSFYFLRVNPAGSYLAYAGTSSGGVVFYNIVFDQPAFDLRVCPLPYEDARHLAATIWWLDRLRSRDLDDHPDFSGMMSSTADGTGSVTVRDATGNVLIQREQTLWSSPLSERWHGSYDPTTFVNFSAYLVAEALTQRLGAAWSSAAPTHVPHVAFQEKRLPAYTSDERLHVVTLTRRFLSEFTPAQEHVSNAIAACAAETAGTLVISDTRPLLEKLLASLPPETAPVRSYDDVSTEYYKVLGTPAPNAKSRAARDEHLRALSAERAAITRHDSVQGPAHLRRTATLALRKINSADDPAALYSWAIAKEDGSQWALQRLSGVDAARYVEALEVWLNTAKGERARQLFDEIRRVDPARATTLADARPPENTDALTVDVFDHLQQSGQPVDDAARLHALLAVLQNPKSGWQPRRKAIDLLVPPENPLRFPKRDVDDALLRVLEPDQADDVINFTLPAACRALALRQRTETFDRIAALLEPKQDAMIYMGVVNALILFAQNDPERFTPRIEKILSPHLEATTKQMNEIFWSIWAADLRGLLPNLERLGTSGPDDYDDIKAVSSGGVEPRVTGRFHMARKIADIWNASDPVTKIRLLTGLALSETYAFVSESVAHERVAALKKALHTSSRTLTPDQRAALDNFFQAVAALPERDGQADATDRAAVIALVKTSIAANP